MENSKRLFIPEGLKEEIQDKVFLHHKKSEQLYYKYLYIIHLLYTHSTLNKEKYNKSGVVLYSGVLNESIGRRDKAKIFENLQKWNYITLTKNYCVGKHSKHYKLSKRLECSKYRVITVPASSACFIKKLIHYECSNNSKVVRAQRIILKEDIRLSEEGLMFIRGKYPMIKDAIELYGKQKELPEDAFADILFDPVDIMLISFLMKEFFVTRPVKESRIYTNLTCLKREYRKFLLLDGMPFYLTDLVNSQILFSVPVILNHLKMKAGKAIFDLPVDFLEYKSLAEEGLVYEAIAKKAGHELTEENRKEFKEKFFEEIFFAEVSPRKTKIKKSFGELFPSVTTAINEIKAKDYTEFPVRLQKMEASVMVKVLQSLHHEGIKALSIHDCIVVNNATALHLAEELITEQMVNRYGIKPKFKSERPECMKMKKDITS